MSPRTKPHLIIRLANALIMFIGVLVVFVALPLFLAAVGGVPIPRPFTVGNVFAVRGVFDLLIVFIWIAWIVIVVDLTNRPSIRSATVWTRQPPRASATA